MYNPDVPEIPAWTLLNEWAGLQFLNQITGGASFSPRFYAGDRTTGNDSYAAENALVEFAAAHGRLHALTAGKQTDFEEIRKVLGPSELGSGYYNYHWLAPTLYETASVLSITPNRGVDDELARLTASLQNPGHFLVYTQGDSCPDNCLFVGSTLRLLDFEGGMFSHALKEGVYGRMHFPTCWCVYRMPEHIPLRMEASYRSELVKGCPEAGDDVLFYHAVVEACALWMMDWYHDFPLPALTEKDRTIVTSTVRQRLLMRSNILARTTEEFGHLEAVGATVRAIAAKLRTQWPESDTMPYYPAFG